MYIYYMHIYTREYWCMCQKIYVYTYLLAWIEPLYRVVPVYIFTGMNWASLQSSPC